MRKKAIKSHEFDSKKEDTALQEKLMGLSSKKFSELTPDDKNILLKTLFVSAGMIKPG